jgi:hypothetical protein
MVNTSLDFVREWRKNQMHMVWHDHSNAQTIFHIVIVNAAIKNYLSRPIGQHTPTVGNEGDESEACNLAADAADYDGKNSRVHYCSEV